MTMLDEIWEREDKATPGPWVGVAETDDHYLEEGDVCWGCSSGKPLVRTEVYAKKDGYASDWQMHFHEASTHHVAAPSGSITGNYDAEVGGILNTADAEFIAHAREDVPKLAGVVDVIKSLHWRQFHTNKPSTCHADGKYWPCPTRQAIEVLA